MVFALSKILWALLSPGSALTLLLAVGVALGFSGRDDCAKTGRRLCLFVTCCFFVIAILPVGDWALLPLENSFSYKPLDQVFGIIVIGGDERPDITEARHIPTAMDSMRRYLTFMDLARRYPNAKLVFSGGAPYPHDGLQDAEVAGAILTDLGVSPERFAVESTSRNTYENALFSADLLHPDPSQKWLLVTSAWHMPRAMGCFRKAGFNISAAPTGYFTDGNFHGYTISNFAEQMVKLTFAMHEYVGLIAYRLMGRTDALWPK